ncbi:TraR/DksA family transcriptional regulator [Streptomyces sp. NBC_00620]|uniref:TraR/DksA family transcriptional regulator n=1 Tax=Streptomyces sp. NBC_00620 TaxID=2903666 RepID=UPI00225091E6|nr:TraR/DksA family transcriptional regulator [Streptomyces sp. NBC_00620]MCX4975265.1 TraR/DksA family transcriptional regulator [Streptomyces sp. NBC_00620]
MVAKKTAVQQSASGRSTGPAAKDVGGKKSAQGAPAEGGAAAKPVKNASKTAAKASKAAARKPATSKAAASKTATSEAADAKTVAPKAAVSKTAAKKATAKKAPAKKAVARKTVGKKAAVAEAVPEETGVAKGGTRKKAGAKRAAKKSSSTAKTAVASAAQGAAQAAMTTGATTVVAKKTPGTATAAKKPTAVPKARVSALVEPGELAVRPGEDPWTPEEVADARAELQSEALRLSSEISASEEALAGLMRDSGDGAGDDQADTGTKNITRESEMALNANAREMLEQTERALQRLDAGTYGLCENCGNPIGKARMQAFPRATLCVECKQKQERRY